MKFCIIIAFIFISNSRISSQKQININISNNKIISKIKLKSLSTTGISVHNKKLFVFSNNEEIIILNVSSIPHIIKKIKIHSTCDSSPFFYKGLLYFGIYHQRVLGINVDTLNLDFVEFFHSLLIMQNTLVAKGDFLFFGGLLGGIFKIHRITGKVLWFKEIESNIWTRPGITNNRIIVADESGNITAYNLSHGKTIWKTNIKTARFTIGRVYIADNKIIVNSHDGTIREFKVSNGTATGRVINVGGVAYSSALGITIGPQRVGNIVYYPSKRGISIVDIAKFKKISSINTKNLPRFVSYKNGLYVNHKENLLLNMDIKGNIKWAVKLDGPLSHNPAIDKEYIYALTLNKTLYKIKR